MASPSTWRPSARASCLRWPRPKSSCQSGSHKRALVIGAETFSRILDWNDRTTCVLFGDGAGAVVVEAQEGTGRARGSWRADHASALGRPPPTKLFVDGGPSTTGTAGHLRMEGREVFKHAVGMITDVITDAFAATGVNAADARLVRAASGQPPHHHRQRRQAAYRASRRW
jgi:3-oxoacyl-[acyl-carrier-protein] synthase III